MADKTIGSLPQATSVDDTSLFVIEQQGAAMKATGAQWKEYAQASVSQYVGQAQTAATQAGNSATQAGDSASAAAESASDAQESAGEAAQSARDAQTAKTASEAAQEAAESAQQAAEGAQSSVSSDASAAEAAKTAALAAQQAAEAAKGSAETSATGAAESASQASKSASDASGNAAAAAVSASTASQAAADAQEAKEGAEAAREAIESLEVAGETLTPEEPVTVTKTVSETGVVTLTFGIPQGKTGARGLPGSSVVRSERIQGTGAPGTTDTWAFYNQDGEQVGTYTVYNGQDGTGAGDMTKAVYDPHNKSTDIFAYVDQKIEALKEELLGLDLFVVQPEQEGG